MAPPKGLELPHPLSFWGVASGSLITFPGINVKRPLEGVQPLYVTRASYPD